MVIATSKLLSVPALAQPSPQLSLRVACAADSDSPKCSFIAHQYATYPFRLSNNLSLDPSDPNRVYAYIMNAGPGLLSGDDLRVVVRVSDRAGLHLTDQSATKVHGKPACGSPARMTHVLEVGNQAYLEYVPEPIIFFPAAALQQQTQIVLHSRGRVVFSEIVVPGRLARGETYEFEQFDNRTEVCCPEGTLHFVDRLKLLGQSNRFRTHTSLRACPVMGSFIVIAPDLDRLSKVIHTIHIPGDTLQIGSSPLPNCHGLLIKARATRISILRHLQTQVLSTTRELLNQPPLPTIPK